MGDIITSYLDSHGIAYVSTYHEHDALTCEDVARERKVRLSQVIKCMVGKGTDGNIYIMLLPGNKSIKIKKINNIVGDKVNFVPADELINEFNLTIGAISPLHFIDRNKNGNVKFFLDYTVLEEDEIDISAGSLTAGILLKTQDLIALLVPKICDIVSDTSSVISVGEN